MLWLVVWAVIEVDKSAFHLIQKLCRHQESLHHVPSRLMGASKTKDYPPST